MASRFKGKRFTVMGLDANGRGLKDTRYLLQEGADVIGTDLRSSAELPEAVELARSFPKLELVLGRHRLEDFRNRDFIIRAALTPLNSPYLKEARASGVSVVSDETLFLTNAPKIKTVGVTGTRGKTTVTHLIYEILKVAFSQQDHSVYLGGNVQDTALLPLLNVVKEGDIVVMELDSWKLQSFAENQISPEVAVFTTFFPDHLNYYQGDLEIYWKDKTAIFKNQKAGDVLIVSEQVADYISRQRGYSLKQKFVVASNLPADWEIKLLGEHNRENAALALAVARHLDVSDEISKNVISNFKGVPGRLEYLGKKRGVNYYNDTTATSPEGVISALKSLNSPGNIILLAGGSDKWLNYQEMMKEVLKYCKAIVLFKGEASEKMWKELRIRDEEFKCFKNASSMQEALEMAWGVLKEGDNILLSPGAASFGIFKNEYDRGEQFMDLFKKLT